MLDPGEKQQLQKMQEISILAVSLDSMGIDNRISTEFILTILAVHIALLFGF